MPYSQFTVEDVVTQFDITLVEKAGTFADIPEVQISELLEKILEYNVPLALAVASEKARSEMIIAPILIELKQQLSDNISLFYGKEFTVDMERGLNGFCDFLISLSAEQIFINAPVILNTGRNYVFLPDWESLFFNVIPPKRRYFTSSKFEFF